MEGEEDTDLKIGYDFGVYSTAYLMLSLLVPVCVEDLLSPGLLRSSR